jgi:hypothetical protein
MKKIIFCFLIFTILIISGCIKPVNISPQIISKEGVEVRVDIVRDSRWYNLSEDIMVINLEIVNNSSENIWVYPLGKSVIIDQNGKQFSPIREIYYQPSTSPKVSFEVSFGTNQPPTFSFNISSSDKEKSLEEVIKTYELLKFKDGRVFAGARVSGLIAFHLPYCKFPARFIIPDVLFETTMRNINFEFILVR